MFGSIYIIFLVLLIICATYLNEKMKNKSISWLLVKINLGVFVLFVFPFLLYSTYIATSYKVWSSNAGLLFLEVLVAPLAIIMIVISVIFSFIGLIRKEKKALIGLIIYLLLGIIYLWIASGHYF